MKSTERHSFLQIRGWPTFLAVLWGLGLGFLFILTFMLTVSSGGKLLQALVIFITLLGILFLFLSIRFLHNEFVVRLLQTLSFLVILLGGLSFPVDPDIFTIVPVAALFLIVFWALNQLNGTTLILAIGTMILTCGWAGGVQFLDQYFSGRDPSYFLDRFIRLFTSSALWFPVLLLIFACAYMPRRIQFNRYFFPYRFRHYKPPDPPQTSSPNSGFTLIEVLIAVAVLSIITAGMMKVWSNTLRSVYNTEQRAQIVTILSCEMNALMTAEHLPAPSPDVHALPLAIDRLYAAHNLTGAYRIASTSQEQLVKIVVSLTQDVGGDAARHYRLESYRTVHQE